MSTKAIVVLCVFVLWLLIMALALYEFDLSGLRAGLDPGNYHGHQVDYAILGFSLAARHWRPHCSQDWPGSKDAEERAAYLR